MKTLFIVLAWSVQGLAAVPQQNFQEKIFLNLREDRPIAVQEMSRLGKNGLEELRKISFNEQIPMKTRWKSFMVLTELQGKKALSDIGKALKSPTWFMRSAGLTALEKANKKMSKKWAMDRLRKDKALMVRLKALQILSAHKDKKVTELFWEKITSEDSFHLNKGLWIREDLAKNLLNRVRKKDLMSWVNLLHDQNPKIQSLAGLALRKIHKDSSGQATDVSYWKEKYPSKKSTRL